MSAPDQPDAPLERRYRRLMASYPQAFRTVYEEEMIGVAMSASKPGQQRPTLRESVTLVGSGLLVRGRRAGKRITNGLRGDAWAEGATAYAFIAAVTITALHGFAFAEALGWRGLVGYGPIGRENTALTIGWALIVVALALRWRRTAAVGATLGAIGQGVAMGLQYGWSPSTFVAQWWQLVLAASAAVAAVIAARHRVAADPMTFRSRVAVLVAGGLTILAGPTETWVTGGDFRTGRVSNPRLQVWVPGYHPVNVIQLVLLAAAAMIGLIVTVRLDGSVRRHAIALAAPVIIAGVATPEVFRGFLISSPEFSPAVQLAAGQWIALILGPVVILVLAALLVDRHEERLELIRLGRQVAG